MPHSIYSHPMGSPTVAKQKKMRLKTSVYTGDEKPV